MICRLLLALVLLVGVLVLVVYFGLVGLGLWVGGCGRLCAGFGGVDVYLVCVRASGLKFAYFMGVSGFVGLNLVLFVVGFVAGWLCAS